MRVRSLPNGGRGLDTDRGGVGVWARSPILLIQLRGYGAGAFADLILAGFDEIVGGKLPVQIFFEMSGMENYESPLRTRLTTHFVQHRARIASLHVFTRSKLVAMGFSVANLALGGLITNHDSLISLQGALDRAIAEGKVAGLSSAAIAQAGAR